MRLFLALELSESSKAALDAATSPLQEIEPALAWVSSGKRHLTLRFLGEVDESRVPEITQEVETAAARHSPFSMRIARIGAFPNFRRARVVWIGVEQDPRLELLHHDVELALERAGFEVEGRPFRPHITLARIRSTLGEDRMRAFARAARRVDFSVEEPVFRLTLFESTLASSGARYRRVHETTLGGR